MMIAERVMTELMSEQVAEGGDVVLRGGGGAV